jgi:predicted AAA+ superfamily ATPase
LAEKKTEGLLGQIILDEIHRAPGLFPVLRGLIDRARRSRRRTAL